MKLSGPKTSQATPTSKAPALEKSLVPPSASHSNVHAASSSLNLGDSPGGLGAEARLAPPARENGRVYLAVPFEEKDYARALGARWEPEAKRWYIPEDRDPYPFKKWWPFCAERKIENLSVVKQVSASVVALPPLPEMTEAMQQIAKNWKLGKEPNFRNIYRWLEGEEPLRVTPNEECPDYAANVANFGKMKSLGAKAAFPLLVRLAMDKTLEVSLRRMAILEMSKAGEQSLPFLNYLVTERKVYTRAAVAEAIVNLGSQGADMLRVLAKDENELVREEAYEAAPHLGAVAIEILIGAGQEKVSTRPWHTAVGVMTRMGERSAPIIQKWIGSAKLSEFRAAMDVLEKTRVSRKGDFERENIRLLARAANKKSLPFWANTSIALAMRNQGRALDPVELEPYLGHQNEAISKEAKNLISIKDRTFFSYGQKDAQD